jgi:sugar/nucleoside kinase (ribokinase family)
MKFLLLGHLCIDVAHPRGGTASESWGGIANAVEALAGLADRNDVILPVTGVGKEDHGAFTAWLGKYPAVENAGVFLLDGPTNRIHLFEQENGARIACTKDMAPPIPFDRIRKYCAADAVLISMASGADITLETLDLIRLEIRPRATPVHFDYHNLTMGVNGAGERVRRPLPEWRRWAFMIPSVQLNEKEIAGLPLERMTEEQTVGHLLTLSVKGVVVTRGADGATLFTSEHKKILRHDIAGVPVPGPPATIGLGDVFGAAFLLRHAATGDLHAAAEFANASAGAAALRRYERMTQ